MKQLQQKNQQNIDLLSADFQIRQEPNYAWRSACSMFLALPGLRGFWPMSSVDYAAANRAIDLSGQGNHLTDNNTVEFGYDSLAPYVHLTSANSEYLSRADGGAGNWADILGTETEILAAYRGLTLGGWFYYDNNAGANNECLIAKATGVGAANFAYRLTRFGVVGTLDFRVSSGAANFAVTATTAIAGGNWFFAVGRYITNTEISLFVNSTEYNNAVAPVASIQDHTSPFTIGARGDPVNYMNGRASMCFLCAAQLSDAIILSLFEQTRALYGV